MLNLTKKALPRREVLFLCLLADKPRLPQKKETHSMRLYICCGTDGNRTSDTRIFSPLLYQLSYGTSVCDGKSTTFFLIHKKKYS